MPNQPTHLAGRQQGLHRLQVPAQRRAVQRRAVLQAGRPRARWARCDVPPTLGRRSAPLCLCRRLAPAATQLVFTAGLAVPSSS